jgi:hypothetical protein
MPDTDKQRSYSAQEYFAFVEDDEWLNSGAFEKVGQQWWAPIVLERARQDRGWATTPVPSRRRGRRGLPGWDR